jgi:hypothetical protein
MLPHRSRQLCVQFVIRVLLDLVEVPRVGDALEAVATPIQEGDPGAGHETFHCAGGKHLSGSRQRGNARTDVHGDTAVIVTANLALTSVYTGAHVDPSRPRRFDDPRAQRIARAGPSNVAKKLSPAVLISRPRNKRSSARTISS